MNSESAYCTFYSGNALYGVAIDTVLEVRVDHPVSRVPLSDPAVAGVMNIRGRIITALDLRVLLGIDAEPGTRPSESLVLASEHEEISLLVDRIGDIHQPGPNALHAPPRTLSEPVAQYITSVYRLEDQLLSVIDVRKLIGGETQSVSTDPGHRNQEEQI